MKKIFRGGINHPEKIDFFLERGDESILKNYEYRLNKGDTVFANFLKKTFESTVNFSELDQKFEMPAQLDNL